MKTKFIIFSLAILILLFAVQPIRTRVVDNLSEIPNITNLKNVVFLIAFDESGSMAPYFQEAKKSLIKHLDTMGSKDVLYLYTFGTDTKPLLLDKNPVVDKDEINTKVSSIKMVYNGWTYITKMLAVTGEKQIDIDMKYRFRNKLLIVYSDNVNDPPPQFREQDRVDLVDKNFVPKLFNGWGKYFFETPSAEKIEDTNTGKVAQINSQNSKSKKGDISNKNTKEKSENLNTNVDSVSEETKEDIPQTKILESEQPTVENATEESDDSVDDKVEMDSPVKEVIEKKENLEKPKENIQKQKENQKDEIISSNQSNEQANTKKQLQRNILTAYLGATVLKLNNKDTDTVFQMVTSSYGYIELIHFTITLFLVLYLVHLVTKHFFSQFYKELEVIFGIITFLFLADFFNFIKGISNAIRVIPNLIHGLFSLIPGVENYTAIFLLINLLLSFLFYLFIIFLYKKYKRLNTT